MRSVRRVSDLCEKYTDLTQGDIRIIRAYVTRLQSMADVTQADFFVECPSKQADTAVIIAHARPRTARSLYRDPVAGQIALKVNEPAVLRTFRTGGPSIGVRGVSLEGVPVKQSVVPIRGRLGTVIGALVMEQGIAQGAELEPQVEMLVETAKNVTESLQAAGGGWQAHDIFLDGFLVADSEGTITYASPLAERLLGGLCEKSPITGANIREVCLDPSLEKAILVDRVYTVKEIGVGDLLLQVRGLPLLKNGGVSGYVLAVRDLTDVRKKERELMVKSAVIQEIHHRIKNNLQMIASLLRLQQRRVDSPETRNAFADSINRVMTIAIVHDVLSRDGLELIDVREVVERIAEMQRATGSEHDGRIAVKVTGDRVVLASRQATSVGLIVNELVNNSMCHAFAGRESGEIEVNLKDEGAYVAVRVSDNGTGFPEEFLLGRPPTLGLSIVQALVEDDLNGTLTAANREGACTQIRFPKKSGPEGVQWHGAVEGCHR